MDLLLRNPREPVFHSLCEWLAEQIVIIDLHLPAVGYSGAIVYLDLFRWTSATRVVGLLPQMKQNATSIFQIHWKGFFSLSKVHF